MIEINPVLTRVLLVVIVILKINIISVVIIIRQKLLDNTDKKTKVPKATPNAVVPTIDPSPVNNVTEDNIDTCHDLVLVCDNAATPGPVPSSVCILRGKNLSNYIVYEISIRMTNCSNCEKKERTIGCIDYEI